ncbi:9957_t:CDS:2, partial [Funneliformis mosseae]
SSKIDIKLEKVNLEFDIFPDDNSLAFRLLLLVRDIEILDEIKTSELGAAWLPHIKSTQVPNVVSGVVKDGRIIRGLQKGQSRLHEPQLWKQSDLVPNLRLERRFCLNKQMKFFSFESQNDTNTRSSTNPTASTIDEEFDSEEDNIKELISKYADRPADLNEDNFIDIL